MDKGPEERPKKKTGNEGAKKLPPRPGRGSNPRYDSGNSKCEGKQNEIPKDVSHDVPKEKEQELVKANRVFYVVLSKGLEKSEKQITYCCGCGG